MSREYCEMAPNHPVHARYHNTEYGFPVTKESVLFERLALEIMQAGLSWEIVLKKRAALNEAFHGFDVDVVAQMGAREASALLKNPNIIRNRLKIQAIITNAGVIQSLRESHGGFAKWLASNHPLDKDSWVKLFRKTFKFTGGEITGEFLMSIGYLPDAHHSSCPVYAKTIAKRPAWAIK